MFDFGVLIWLVGAVITGCALVSLGRGSPWQRNRDAWLLQHFGKAGRDRWLLNDKLLGYLSKPLSEREAARIRAKYGADCFAKAHRVADGSCRGLAEDRDRFNPSLNYQKNPPWKTGLWYDRKHNHPNLHNSVDTDGHGEPRAADWFAAGFCDKVVRDDGVVVDPLNVLYYDMAQYWVEFGRPNIVIVGSEGMRDRAEKFARAHVISHKFFYELNYNM